MGSEPTRHADPLQIFFRAFRRGGGGGGGGFPPQTITNFVCFLDILHIFSPHKSNLPPKTISLEKKPCSALLGWRRLRSVDSSIRGVRPLREDPRRQIARCPVVSEPDPRKIGKEGLAQRLGGSVHYGMLGILLIAELCKACRVSAEPDTRTSVLSSPLGVHSIIKRSKTRKRFSCG